MSCFKSRSYFLKYLVYTQRIVFICVVQVFSLVLVVGIKVWYYLSVSAFSVSFLKCFWCQFSMLVFVVSFDVIFRCQFAMFLRSVPKEEEDTNEQSRRTTEGTPRGFEEKKFSCETNKKQIRENLLPFPLFQMLEWEKIMSSFKFKSYFQFIR